jgi:uncharacterized membrane protein
MKSWHDSDLTPEAFFARQRLKKRLWLALVMVAIAIAVAALL